MDGNDEAVHEIRFAEFFDFNKLINKKFGHILLDLINFRIESVKKKDSFLYKKLKY